MTEHLATVGPLDLDPEPRRVAYRGEMIRISPSECDLLRSLMLRADRIVNAEALAADVWGEDIPPPSAPLRHLVYRLRSRLESIGCFDPVIENRSGIGYGLIRAEAP